MSKRKDKNPSILGGISLKEKLDAARRELGELHHENNVAHKDVDCIKFHLGGRCSRTDNKYITKAFYILNKLDTEIKMYCRGGDIALFNYLIHLGLSEIKKGKSSLLMIFMR